MPKAHYVFIWENFGPQHHDRLNAVAAHFGSSASILGVELSETSDAYLWQHHVNSNIQHQVLCRKAPHFFSRSLIFQLRHLLPLLIRQGRACYALCHYEQPAIFILACLLRLLGRRVIIMNDSKFDDYDRTMWREVLKFLLYLPYQGALVASHRSASYLHFLGIRRQFIRLNYDNLSRDRVRSYIPDLERMASQNYEDRDFVVIARLIEKKNLFRTLDAYHHYRMIVRSPRKLIIIGYGPLDAELKAHADAMGIKDHVEFTGPMQPDGTMKRLHQALALLLLSTEEQFGHVVLEAQALSIPVIVSHAVGAVDCFVRNNTNGLIVDPFDVDGIARAMAALSEDRTLWNKLSDAAEIFSEKGDARHFATSLEDLTRSLS